ncbi:MAG: hypothetical protein WD048_15460, partial [Chitinophagales bacterium]
RIEYAAIAMPEAFNVYKNPRKKLLQTPAGSYLLQQFLLLRKKCYQQARSSNCFTRRSVPFV